MVKTCQRFDSPNPTKITKLETGGYRIEVALSRTGVQRYTDSQGKPYYEYRAPEQVFSPESMASFRGVPVTIGHPKGFVGPDNFKSLTVGHVCDDIRQEGDLLVGSVVVQDREAIDAIDVDALRDVSCGYSVKVDPTPGQAPDGTHYDAQQVQILGNHLALLPKGQGRGGPEVHMRLDSALDSVSVAETVLPSIMPNDRPLPEVQVVPVAAPVDTSKARIDQLEGELRAQAATIAQLKASLNKAKDPKRLDSMVAERASLLAVSLPILGNDYRVDGKSPDEIRKDVVAKALPGESLDEVSSDYIKGLFKGVVGAAEKAPAPGLAAVRADAMNAPVVGANKNDVADAYQRRLRADAARCKPAGVK